MNKKTYPCTFPIYLKDGFVVRCWHCPGCKKFVTYLEKEIKKTKKPRSSFDLHLKKFEDYIK